MSTSRDKKPGKVIGFKIEHDRPEDSANSLATRLTDAIQLEMSARQDAMEYKSQAQRERQKAKELSNVLVMLTEYNRKKKKAIANGEEWNPSRMEPMESYDEEMIRAERMELVDRARKFDSLVNDFEKLAKESKQEQGKLQRKLREAKG